MNNNLGEKWVPITGCRYMPIHPKPEEYLKITPKQKYYMEKHIERWEKKYKTSYPRLTGIIGSYHSKIIIVEDNR